MIYRTDHSCCYRNQPRYNSYLSTYNSPRTHYSNNLPNNHTAQTQKKSLYNHSLLFLITNPQNPLQNPENYYSYASYHTKSYSDGSKLSSASLTADRNSPEYFGCYCCLSSRGLGCLKGRIRFIRFESLDRLSRLFEF